MTRAPCDRRPTGAFLAERRLPARPVPARGPRRPRPRPVGPRGRPDRLGQDRRRRVRRGPRPRPRATVPSTRRPLKALSNQKYGDFATACTAPERVGLLTGDVVVNGDADVVVMTTEVLRNMIYSGTSRLARLGLRRARRGALPRGPLPGRRVGGDHPHRPAPGGVRLPLGDGLQRRGARGLDPPACGGRRTSVIEERPADRAAQPVRRSPTARPAALEVLPTFVEVSPTPRRARPRRQGPSRQPPGPLRRGPAHRGGGRRAASPRPSRVEVVGALRRGRSAPGDLLRLLPGGMRRGRPPVPRRRRPAHHRRGARRRSARWRRPTSPTSTTATCASSATRRFLSGLEAGLASHHAGLVPPFREAVEALLRRGPS